MKSSETPTDSPAEPSAEGSLLDRLKLDTGRLILGGLFVVGSIVILHVNGWRWGAPEIFLCMGWLGILASGRFLWTTAMTAAAEGEDDGQGFEVATSRRDDLLREKRSVLKAIKEIEFDHALDKMSRRDADELLAIYRRRAIAIIKELEGGDTGSVADIIDREVKARLTVQGASKAGKGKGKGKSKARAAAASEKTPANGEDESSSAAAEGEAEPAEGEAKEDRARSTETETDDTREGAGHEA